MKNVVAVVVTYNRKELLKENIDALFKQSVHTFDIIIIDNASTDGTGEFVQSIMKDNSIQYINIGKNIGGAGGFSFGIKRAVELGYEHIWIMDDDTIPSEQALENLLAVASENNDYGFLASTVLWTDGTWNQMNLLRNKETNSWHDFEEYKTIHEPISINRASFVSLLINANAVRTEGLPIKEFFIWSDDQEYTDRISKKYNCYYVSDSVVIHKTASNVGANLATDSYDRIQRYGLAFRNEYYIARRNKTKKEYRGTIKGNILQIIRNSTNHKLKRLSTLFHGVIKGIFFKPSIEYPKK